MHIRLGFADVSCGAWFCLKMASGQGLSLWAAQWWTRLGVRCPIFACSEAELLTHSCKVKVVVAIYYICHHAGIDQWGHTPSSLIVMCLDITLAHDWLMISSMEFEFSAFRGTLMFCLAVVVCLWALFFFVFYLSSYFLLLFPLLLQINIIAVF